MGKHRVIKQKNYPILLVVGELLITSGLVLGLYVAYELWGSNVVAQQTWTSTTDDLLNEFKNAIPDPAASTTPEPIKLTEKPKAGKAFALLYVPKLWANENPVPILEGTETRDLAKGIGHYADTALPGEVGNFAVAGHRATHGQPFAEFQKLAKGDQVVVETLAGKYVYRLVADQKVTPEDVWVITPKPSQPELDKLPAGSKMITLTTCDPRWSSERRWIWWGVLETFTPRATGAIL